MQEVIESLCILIIYINPNIYILASEIRKCASEDSECLRKSFTDIMQNHPEGYSAIAIPAIDPFHIKKLDIVLDGERPLNIKLYFKDLDVFGLSHSETTKVR